MKSELQPLVSVVIPCYNHENFVQDCIQSVIDQSYQNIELIIIDDGSKDSSIIKIQEMVSKCTERFVRFQFRHRPNKGLSATLNEGLDWCKGEYFVGFASDDIMLEDRIAFQVNTFHINSNSELMGVFGGCDVIDNNDNLIQNVIYKKKKYFFKTIFLHHHRLLAPTALLKLSEVKKVGGYDNNIKVEDWFMWLKLTENGGYLLNINRVLVKYRRHTENTSANYELLYSERKKIIDLFKNRDDYKMALYRLEWMNMGHSLEDNSQDVLNEFLRFIKNNPTQLFNQELVRFCYKVFQKKIVN